MMDLEIGHFNYELSYVSKYALLFEDAGTYFFNPALHFSVEEKDNVWVFKNDDFDFISYQRAESLDKALDGVAEDFDDLYRHLVYEDDEDLTPGAIILKNKMLGRCSIVGGGEVT